MLKLFKRAKEEPITFNEDLEPAGNTSKLLKSIDDGIALATAKMLHPDTDLNDLNNFDEEEIDYFKNIGYVMHITLRGYHVDTDNQS